MVPFGLKPPSRSAVSFSVTGGPSVTEVWSGVVLSVGLFAYIGSCSTGSLTALAAIMQAGPPWLKLLGMRRARRRRTQVAGAKCRGLTITGDGHLAFEHQAERIEFMAVLGTRFAGFHLPVEELAVSLSLKSSLKFCAFHRSLPLTCRIVTRHSI